MFALLRNCLLFHVCVCVCVFFWLNSTLPCHSIGQAHMRLNLTAIDRLFSKRGSVSRHFTVSKIPHEKRKTQQHSFMRSIESTHANRGDVIREKNAIFFSLFKWRMCVFVCLLSNTCASDFRVFFVLWTSCSIFEFSFSFVTQTFWTFFSFFFFAHTHLTMREQSKRSEMCVLRLFDEILVLLRWTRSFPPFCEIHNRIQLFRSSFDS